MCFIWLMYELILVSQSPRRRQLLMEAGFEFSSSSVKVSEIIDENLNLKEAIAQVARQKAEAFVRANKPLKSQKILVLAADTVVVYGGRVLGKPKNLDQAREFLELLSGKTHEVMTGLCLYSFAEDYWHMKTDRTLVRFKTLLSEDVDSYLAKGESMDKAGGYGIQGEGAHLVESFEGSKSNVVGLPMELLNQMLQERGWHVRQQRE